jgi:hypothetical protein
MGSRRTKRRESKTPTDSTGRAGGGMSNMPGIVGTNSNGGRQGETVLAVRLPAQEIDLWREYEIAKTVQLADLDRCRQQYWASVRAYETAKLEANEPTQHAARSLMILDYQTYQDQTELVKEMAEYMRGWLQKTTNKRRLQLEEFKGLEAMR